MAPRRNNHGHGHGEVQGLHIDPETIENHDPNVTKCCVPSECLRNDALIKLDNLSDVIKVICNNDHCNQSQYMHRECFDSWEQNVLQYLKSCGRARSWSEKQRHQNLWTKKGYDLAFKACSCKCSRGHLKKDLDWIPPKPVRPEEADGGKKKRKKHKQNSRPALAVSAPTHHHPNTQGNVAAAASPASTPNTTNMSSSAPKSEAQTIASESHRNRAGSMSSTGSSGGSPSASVSSEAGGSPAHTANKKKSKFDFFSDRSRHGSGGSGGGGGIFSRRLDFSSFNSLPRHKLNSYHIQMEDEGNHGNDETRCFILSTLAALHTSRMACVLCHASMLVFDRYPLVDGTFFLSPRQHSKSCLEVRLEGRSQYLSAVCMNCLEGWNGPLQCRFCSSNWDGAALVLGTMYSYDIYAATPCCAERLKCNSCQKLVLHPQQQLNFYSDYSHALQCPHCSQVDFHFVKPLNTFVKKEDSKIWPQ